jgi:hypothetical protein
MRSPGRQLALPLRLINPPIRKDLKGRPLTVNEARPRTDRPRTGGGGGGRGGFGGGRGRY